MFGSCLSSGKSAAGSLTSFRLLLIASFHVLHTALTVARLCGMIVRMWQRKAGGRSFQLQQPTNTLVNQISNFQNRLALNKRDLPAKVLCFCSCMHGYWP